MRRAAAIGALAVAVAGSLAALALAAGSAGVSLSVRPTIYARDLLTAYGAVATGRSGEPVTLQFKQCGLYPLQFRDVAEVTTEAGGSWSAQFGIAANGTARAVSGGDASNEVKLLARADVRLAPTRSGKYEINVVARASFWRKRVLLQRYDPKRGWATVRTLRLESSGAAPGSTFVWSTTDPFAVKLPKGTTMRAVLPLDQARPCFIGGYSTLLRR